MAVTTTALLIASLAATAIGGGISAYGQYQAGKTQNNIAMINAAEQERQARNQMLSMQTQAALAKQQAEANFKMRAAEAAAREINAQSIDNSALSQDAVNRLNLRKQREGYARQQSEQRSAIAASGIIETTGTPLDLLAETASTIQRDQEEVHQANEMNRRTIFREAAAERLGGQMGLAGASLDRNAGLAEAKLRSVGAKLEYQSGRRQAEITRMTGGAARSAANIGAIGTLFSTAGSVYSGAKGFQTS